MKARTRLDADLTSLIEQIQTAGLVQRNRGGTSTKKISKMILNDRHMATEVEIARRDTTGQSGQFRKA